MRIIAVLSILLLAGCSTLASTALTALTGSGVSVDGQIGRENTEGLSQRAQEATQAVISVRPAARTINAETFVSNDPAWVPWLIVGLFVALLCCVVAFVWGWVRPQPRFLREEDPRLRRYHS